MLQRLCQHRETFLDVQIVSGTKGSAGLVERSELFLGAFDLSVNDVLSTFRTCELP